MPSVPGQESVIRQAYANAGASLGETDYVEVTVGSVVCSIGADLL